MKNTQRFAASVFTILLALLILPSKSYAQETKPGIQSKSTEQEETSAPTEKRHLIEFTELSMKRFMEFEEKYNKDYDLRVTTQFVPFREYMDVYEVDSTFGTISFDKKDFHVSSIIMTMSVEKEESSKNEQYLFQCISAVSALEYDEIDNSLIELEHKIKKTGPSSAFEKTIQIWGDEIQPRMKEIVQKSKGKSIDRELIYSGNYNYYLSTMDSGKGIINFIIATEKEK